MSSSQKQHTLHLMVYHRALFKAHWALFVPSLTNHDIGKRIDASGDVRKGFHHVLTRNFDLKMEDRTYSLIEIGALTKGCCLDDELGEEAVDEGPTVAGARNELERLMLGVEAPGPSMRSANSQVSKQQLGWARARRSAHNALALRSSATG